MAHEFSVLTRIALVRRARARAALDTIAATLNHAGVTSVFVGRAALAGLNLDAEDAEVPLDVLVRPQNLALATSLLAQLGGSDGEPLVRLQGTWRPAAEGPELTFDQVITTAKPLGASRSPALRAANAFCMVFLCSQLSRCTDVQALLAHVVAIDAAAGDGGPPEWAHWHSWARSVGLPASGEAAFMLRLMWLGGPLHPAGAGDERLPHGLSSAERMLLAHLARTGLRVDAGSASPAARWVRACMRLLMARIRARDARASRQPYAAFDLHSQLLDTLPRVQQGALAITYDGRAADGVGAQLQRIYSLYALSRALGVAYVHTPLQVVNYQGLLPLLEGRIDADFCARYNDVFHLDSDPFEFEGCEVCDIYSPCDLDIERFRQYVRDTGRRVLLRSHTGYDYTDRHPEAYAALQAVSPYRDAAVQGRLRVCVHLRRGDRVASKDPRLQPNAFFISVCEQIAQELDALGQAYEIRLHTELPDGVATLEPGQKNLFVSLDAPVTLDPRAHALHEFDRLPHLKLVLNVEPMEAFQDFGTADVLVLSYSSFGYVPGLLNPHGLVVCGPDLPYPRNFHAALPGWLVSDQEGQLARSDLAGALEAMLRRRSLRATI